MLNVVGPYVLPKGDYSIAMADVIQSCVQSKGDNNMPVLMSSYRVCCPRAMMACHSRHRSNMYMLSRAMMACHACRRPTVCAVQGRRWHVTPIVVRPRVLPNGDDGMPRPMPSYRACCLMAKMECHARRHPTVYDVQGR